MLLNNWFEANQTNYSMEFKKRKQNFIFAFEVGNIIVLVHS
jgi:hypothetical protein